MNIYDTRIVHCVECDTSIGELDEDAQVLQPKCGNCVKLMEKTKNNLMHVITTNKIVEKPVELSMM